MHITEAALDFIAGAISGTGTVFNSTNSFIGVGNSSAAFSADLVDLQGVSKFRKGMEAGYPIVNGSTITYKAIFADPEANFAWNEWGIFNAASGGVMLCRVVQANGTKLPNQTWIYEVQVTFQLN